MWFGEPGHCLVYKLMLPALVIAAFGDLMISVGMMALGTESSRMSKSKKRCAVAYPISRYSMIVGHFFAQDFRRVCVQSTSRNACARFGF